jgi:glycerophosphoryl diester phosphodiesterase
MRYLTTLALALVCAVSTLAPGAAAQESRSAADVSTVAHRGARFVAPENTLTAIRAALDRGADMVELDVQRSKDGRLVLIHDQDLRRTTNVERVFPRRASYDVAAFTYRDMRRLDAGRWKRDKYAGERIPTLKQAVRLLQRRRAGLLLELKSPSLYPGLGFEVSAALRRVDGYLGWAIRRDKLVVQSFDFDVARAFKDIEPRVPVALLGTPAVADLPGLAQWADEISARHKTIDAGYVAAVHAAGMSCSVWTVDTKANMNASLDKGVDAVVTNRPDLLGRVLQRRAAAGL